MDFDPIKNQMICMLCHKRFESLKRDTIKKHHRSRHLGVAEYPTSKKRHLVLKYEAEQKKPARSTTRFSRSAAKDSTGFI